MGVGGGDALDSIQDRWGGAFGYWEVFAESNVEARGSAGNMEGHPCEQTGERVEVLVCSLAVRYVTDAAIEWM